VLKEEIGVGSHLVVGEAVGLDAQWVAVVGMRVEVGVGISDLGNLEVAVLREEIGLAVCEVGIVVVAKPYVVIVGNVCCVVALVDCVVQLHARWGVS
jgi:hypothetical protein